MFNLTISIDVSFIFNCFEFFLNVLLFRSILSIISRHIAHHMQSLLQSDAQLWEKLLHTSGGKLEIPKCNFSVFDWDFDKFGRAHLIEPTFTQLLVTSSDNHKQLVIPILKTNCSYKYVGLHIALDGNMTEQALDLQKKCKNIAILFTQSYFNAKDSEQGFMTIYSPIVKYALPTTSISDIGLQKIQQPVITSVLSRLEYNKNMPRAIIHSSTMYGGVGLLDFFTEQGCSQVQLLLAHLRSQTYIHNQIISLLESFQVQAGNRTSPLEHIESIGYVHSPWMNTVRGFLSTFDATITIPQLSSIKLIRQHDKAIMNKEALSQYSKSKQEMINACRLFLKVNTVAEISNHQGYKILDCISDCAVSSEGSPILHDLSESKLNWPYQTRPPRKARLTWKKYISSLIGPNNNLRTFLGPWNSHVHEQISWKFLTYSSDIIHLQNNAMTRFELVQGRSRHKLQFIQRNIIQHNITNINLPITPQHSTQTTLYTVQQYTHTYIPIAIHTGDNVSIYTINPEFPTDNILHIYTRGLPMKPKSSIIISNIKISRIIEVNVASMINATSITPDIMCLIHTLHCIRAHYY
jgi:hypothetical protein